MGKRLLSSWRQYLIASAFATVAEAIAWYLEAHYPLRLESPPARYWAAATLGFILVIAMLTEAFVSYKLCARIPPWHRRFSPSAAALGLLAPFFNWIWPFILFHGLADGLARWERDLAKSMHRRPLRLNGLRDWGLTVSTLAFLQGVTEALFVSGVLPAGMWMALTSGIVTVMTAIFYGLCLSHLRRLLSSPLGQDPIAFGPVPRSRPPSQNRPRLLPNASPGPPPSPR